MRKAIIGGAVVLALSFSASWAQTPPAPSNPKVAAQFAKARAERDAGQAKVAHETLAALTKSPEFSTEAPEIRGRILALDAAVAGDLGLTSYAFIAARSASRLPGQDGLRAQVRLIDLMQNPDHTAARQALIALATEFPATLNETPDIVIQSAAGRPTPDATSEALQSKVAEALLAHWTPQNPFQVMDYLRLRVLAQHLKDGRLAEAREVASGLEAINIVLTLRMDRRYDALFADGWSLPTGRETTEAQLTRLRVARAAYPRLLSGVRREADYLRTLNVQSEALALIDAALAQADRSAAAFDDTADWLIDVRGMRSTVLYAMGRRDEALRAERSAAYTPANNRPSSVPIANLALDIMHDDPREAVRLVGVAEERGLNPYGQLMALSILACAQPALGKQAEADNAYRRLSSAKAPGANLWTLEAALCRADADQAAKSLIATLQDNADRQRALRQMQIDWPNTNPPQTPQARARADLFRQVVFRADVQAALAPYGRIVKATPEEVWRR